MSQALVDSLVCFEMPIFAIAHVSLLSAIAPSADKTEQYAFQASDYIDPSLKHQARLPFTYAFRDAFGLKDVWQDSKDTFRGRGISYQAYEPAEGALHYGLGRQKRIRAGLRYSKGGKAKYWLPTPGDESRSRGDRGPIASLKRRVDERLAAREGYAPLLPKQAARVVHDDPDEANGTHHGPEWTGLSSGLFADSDSDGSDAPSLEFDSVGEDEDGLYDRARRIGYAGFPNIDVSQEEAKRRRWEEEEAILAGRRNENGHAGPSRQGKSNRVPRVDVKRGNSDVKGKGKPKQAVYGACESYTQCRGNLLTMAGADRVSQVDLPPNPRVVSSQSIRGHNPTGEGVWLVSPEDPTASPPEPTSVSTKKSKSRLDKLKPPIRRSQSNRSQNAAFALGDESDGDDESDSDRKAKQTKQTKQTKRLPSDARDLVVEDVDAVEDARARERRRGEPQTKAPAHVYVHRHTPDLQRVTSPQKSLEPKTNGVEVVKKQERPETGVRVEESESLKAEPVEIEEVYSPALGDDRPTTEEVGSERKPHGDEMDVMERMKEAIEPTPPPSRHPTSSHYPDQDNPWA